MFDETQEKIMNAAMELIMEKGYGSATTREIAVRAGVNECTLFRKFAGKKDIVLSAMTLPRWNPQLKESDFRWTGDLTEDLTNFSRVYGHEWQFWDETIKEFLDWIPRTDFYAGKTRKI